MASVHCHALPVISLTRSPQPRDLLETDHLAHDVGVPAVPVVVTDRAPDAVVVHLHTTLTRVVAVHQSHSRHALNSNHGQVGS